MSAVTPQLLNAYLQAHYRYQYRKRWCELRAGDALDRLTLPTNTCSAAFITAMNPHSTILSETDNQRRHRALLHKLAKEQQRWLPAAAVDPLQQWPTEYGVLWLNPTRANLVRYLQQFEQHAALVSWGAHFELQSI